MPTVDERLKQVTLKIKRANEHVADLERQQQAFLDSNPYKVGAKPDPQTGKVVYYVTSVESTPECLPLVAGDAIQNLMSALDHLAYQLVCSDTGDKPPSPRKIYFPITDTVEKYDASKAVKMEGALPETLAAIDLLKPYKAGNDLLWTLHQLNNIEKHRLLLTVGSQAAGIHLGQLAANLQKDFIPPEALALLETVDVFLMPADKGFPLKAGFELLGTQDEKPNPKQTFRFTIALNEPGIAEGQPLLETVRQLTNAVDGVITALTPRLI